MDTSDDDGINDEDPTIVTLTQTPELTLLKTSDATGNEVAGDVITHTFEVTNTGNVTGTGLNIDDALTGTTALSLTPSTLAPGAVATATATYTVLQADVDNGSITNQATLDGHDPDNAHVTDTSDDEGIND